MERLTHKLGGVNSIKDCLIRWRYVEGNSNNLSRAIDKLAEYEDTGLTPEEIENDVRVHTELWEEKIKELQHERDSLEEELNTLMCTLDFNKIVEHMNKQMESHKPDGRPIKRNKGKKLVNDAIDNRGE